MENKFKQYDLTGNPFIEEHNQDVVGKNPKKLFKVIINRIFEKSKQKDRFLAFFVGDYGYGKTFFLNKITDKAINDKKYINNLIEYGEINLVVSKFNILKSDKTIPTDIMLHLYKSIILNLNHNGEEFFKKLYNEIKDNAIASKKEIEELLKPLDKVIIKVFTQYDEDNPNQFFAWKWISGEKLSQKELGILGVPFSINNQELAEKYLFNVLKLIDIAGYDMLCVFIDEVEESLNVTGKRKFTQTLLVIKEIYDKFVDSKYSRLKPMAPIGIFCGLTPDITNLIDIEMEKEKALEPLKARIADNHFTLEKLSDDEIKEFIEIFLEKTRIEKYKGNKLFPFVKEAILEISSYTDGNPREILKDCESLLNNLASEKGKQIDREFTKKFYEERGATTTETFDSPDESEKIWVDEDEKI